MAVTVKQLANRRRMHSISRSAVAERMGCTIAWVRFVEAGGCEGKTLNKWRGRYQVGLEEILREKKAEARS